MVGGLLLRAQRRDHAAAVGQGVGPKPRQAEATEIDDPQVIDLHVRAIGSQPRPDLPHSPRHLEAVRHGSRDRRLVDDSDGRAACGAHGVGGRPRVAVLVDVEAQMSSQSQWIRDNAESRTVASDLDADTPAGQGSLRIDAVDDRDLCSEAARDQTRLISGEQHAHDVMRR